MNIIIRDETFIIKNENFSLSKLLDYINSYLHKSLILSCLKIDGSEIYENYSEYIDEYLSSIDTIEVVLKTQKEYLDEMLLTADNYLINGIPAIKQLSNEFYKGPSSDSWGGLEHLFEAMQWLADLIGHLDKNKTIYSCLSQTWTSELNFRELLKNMDEAVSNSDPILIADVLSYELLPMFQSIQNKIQTVIDSEVKRDALN